MNYLVRIPKLIFGLCLFPIGISMNIKANIGNAPWDAFHIGIAKHLGWEVGTVGIVVGLIILFILVLFGEKIGLGTVLNILLIGALLNVTLNLMPSPDNIFIRYGMFLFGMFIISWGSYYYISSGFGAGPRDTLMIVLEKATGLKVGICRFIVEFLATVFGFLLGGKIGVGTIITVFVISYSVQFVFGIMKFNSAGLVHESLKDTYNNMFGKNKH